MEDLTGRTFTRWTVLRFSHRAPGGYYWYCRCHCGTKREVAAATLRNGKSPSCGCISKERVRTHGESRPYTPEYTAWNNMQKRCKKAHADRVDYFDRGIKVCDRWLGPTGYQNFLEDMGRRPGPGYSVDRKNNDGNYEKDNCYWATDVEQQRNKRNNVWLTYKGKTMVAADWADLLGIHRRTLFNRLKHGWSVERALTEPVHLRT